MTAIYTTPESEPECRRSRPASVGTCVRMGHSVRFDGDQLAAAISSSRSWAETLRRLGYKSAGGNWRTVQKYARAWDIDCSHFDSMAASLEGLRRSWGRPPPLSEILIEGSTYKRGDVKRRLFSEGLKEKRCELCGQGEEWRGQRMALILDHINGVPDDNRLENLRIACPNCAATFATHCGRKNKRPNRRCSTCGGDFAPKKARQAYCTRACALRRPRPSRRIVERPPYGQLLAEIEQSSYSAVGRKYGVSDNAVRKWVRCYENEIETLSRDGLGDEETK